MQKHSEDLTLKKIADDPYRLSGKIRVCQGKAAWQRPEDRLF